MKNRLFGSLITLTLSSLILTIFFGKSIFHLNSTYFSSSGDGFKAYYGAMYHVKYDTLASRTMAMNYPFGEMITFTDSQSPVSNSIRFFSRYIVDISDYTPGIINGCMLISFILAALFIFLILCELDVAWWYSSAVAIGISMLSPQIARMGGHFSLSWLFWIPVMVYWLIRFNKTRSVLFTLLIGFTTLLAGKMHLYFVGMFGFLIGGYWFWRFIWYKKTTTYWYRDILFFFAQYLLPVIILQSSISFNDIVTDRTSFPYGFFVFLGHPAAILLPSGQPWAFIPRIITVFNHISWEALSWIGQTALAGILAGIFFFIKKIIRRKPLGKLTGSTPLNVLFWVSVVALIFSFGVPFVFDLKSWADYLGPLRQLRALARFGWLFYYLINIVVFARIFSLAYKKPASLTWKIVSFFALAVLFFDGFWNMHGNIMSLKNRIPELEDTENKTEINQWIHKLDVSDYQAIIPVPYFHNGSENIWIDGDHQAKETTMIACLKSGLPTTGVEMSRTSISQTFINYTLFSEPLQKPELTDFLPNQKPFLVLWMNSYTPNEQESLLLEGAVPVLKNEKFTLLSLPVVSISNSSENWRQKCLEKFNESPLFSSGTLKIADSLEFFKYLHFDTLPATNTLRGSGAFTYPSRKWKTLYEDTLKHVPSGKKLILSFWVNGYQQDACMRANLEIFQKNSRTDEVTNYIYSDFFRHLKAFTEDWALVEIEIETMSDDEYVKASVRNTVLPDKIYTLDEMLIREKTLDIWEEDGKYLYMDTRRFNLR
jgi:hypothetical protein